MIEICKRNDCVRLFMVYFTSESHKNDTYRSIIILGLRQLNNWLFWDDKDVSGSLR